MDTIMAVHENSLARPSVAAAARIHASKTTKISARASIFIFVVVTAVKSAAKNIRIV
jgi:hypothetical protein